MSLKFYVKNFRTSKQEKPRFELVLITKYFESLSGVTGGGSQERVTTGEPGYGGLEEGKCHRKKG